MGSEDEDIKSVSSGGRPGSSERGSVAPRLDLRGGADIGMGGERTVLPKELVVSVEAGRRIEEEPSDLDGPFRGVSTSPLNPVFDRGVEGDPEFSV